MATNTQEVYGPRLVAAPAIFKQVVCGLDAVYALDVRGDVHVIRVADLPEAEDIPFSPPKMEMDGIPDKYGVRLCWCGPEGGRGICQLNGCDVMCSGGMRSSPSAAPCSV